MILLFSVFLVGRGARPFGVFFLQKFIKISEFGLPLLRVQNAQ